MNRSADRNAKYFNATARRYRERELVEHDAIVAWPLYDRAVARAHHHTPMPRVLDVGAGVGISTLPMLERGCRVTAVDVSGAALQRLSARAGTTSERLETVQADGAAFLDHCGRQGRQFDIVLCRAFLHHVPDYLDFLQRLAPIVAEEGCLISLADPMRYDSVSRFERRFSQLTYYSMRLFRGHYLRGFKTLRRRLHGELREDLPEDNVEYHMVRNGVDQEAVRSLLVQQGFECEILSYFGWANPVMRPLGRWLGVRSSFACFATRKVKSATCESEERQDRHP